MSWSDLQKTQFHVMGVIAKSLAETPMVLKGGTALLMCYGLDRFSEDLDFDCPIKLRLESKILSALKETARTPTVTPIKEGENVTRYRIEAETIHGRIRLKLETSHRDQIDPSEVTIIDGVKVYTIEALIRMKMSAIANRTAARDLYDIHFLSGKYGDAFGAAERKQLKELVAEPDALLARFKADFQDDPILGNVETDRLVLQLAENAQALGDDNQGSGRMRKESIAAAKKTVIKGNRKGPGD